MKKLLSLKKFQKENQDALLEKEILAKINGGIGGSNTLDFQNRDTLDDWNCRDRYFRARWDGQEWGPWLKQWDEAREFYGPYC